MVSLLKWRKFCIQRVNFSKSKLPGMTNPSEVI